MNGMHGRSIRKSNVMKWRQVVAISCGSVDDGLAARRNAEPRQASRKDRPLDDGDIANGSAVVQRFDRIEAFHISAVAVDVLKQNTIAPHT